MNKKKFEINKKNLFFIISIASTILVALTSIFKFIEYVISTNYFSYYGLDINLYDYSRNGYVYYLIYSFLFMLASSSILFYVGDIYELIKNKIKTQYCRFKICIIILSNLFFVASLKNEINVLNIIIFGIVLVLIELVLYNMLKKEINREFKDIKQAFFEYIKILPILIIVFIIAICIQTNIKLKTNRNYRVIDENKIIVYTTNDYYLLLDCKIENNKIIIYKGRQEKVINNNINSYLRTFDDVELVYE